MEGSLCPRGEGARDDEGRVVVALGTEAPVPVGFVVYPLAHVCGCSENTYPESWGRGFIAVRLAGLVGFRQAREDVHPVGTWCFGKPCFQLF